MMGSDITLEVRLLQVAEFAGTVVMVGAPVIELSAHHISRDCVSDILVCVCAKPHVRAVSSAGVEHFLTAVDKDVGANTNQPATAGDVIHHAAVEGLVEVLDRAVLQPADEPIDEGVVDIAVVLGGVCKVVDDAAEVQDNMRLVCAFSLSDLS